MASETGENVMSQDEVNWDEQVEFLRGLAAIVRDEELSELVVEQNGVRLSLRSRRPSMVPPETPSVLPTTVLAAPMLSALGEDLAPEEAAPAGPEATETAVITGTPVVSPMVGVFYRSKSPDDPSFVEVGDRVEVGQVIGLVEAMKTFNEIVSEIEGEVVQIAANNGALVETGAPLVYIQ